MNRSKLNPEKLVTGAVIAGVAVASAALVWPLAQNLEVEVQPPAPVFAPVAPPSIAMEEELEPEPVVELEVEAPVDGTRPLVALPTDDRAADHAADAMRAMDDGDLASAFASLRKHLYLHDPSSEILLHVGILGRQLGELAVAEQALLDAGALDPRSPAVQVELARLYLDAKELQKARHAARQAIRLDAEHAPAWNLAGRVAMEENEWQRAEASFRRSVELDPTDAMLRNNLGLLYVRMRRPEAAVEALETAVELYADDVPYFVYNNLGLAFEQSESLEDARDAYEAALSVNPMYSRARVNLERTLTALAAREARSRAPATAELPGAEE